MSARQYPKVGDTITGDDLSDLSAGGVVVFANLAAAIAADPQPALRTIAVLLDEQRLALRYYDTDGEAWRILESQTGSHFDRISSASRRVPSLAPAWERSHGAITIMEALAAIGAGDWQTADGHLFDASATEDGDQVEYEIGEDTTLTAGANCEITLVAIGAGGSGAGMAFTTSHSANGKIYPHSPSGGGGGGAGTIIPLTLRLARGDELAITIGAGGEPEDVTGSSFTTIADSGAGGDTSISLNGVEILRAAGGAGGRTGLADPIDELLDGSDLHASFNVGNGGGGAIVPSEAGEWASGRTANPPTSWEFAHADPPVGHRRRGGDGTRLAASGHWIIGGNTESEAITSGTWHAYAGSGGGGVDSNGTLRHGATGAHDSSALSPLAAQSVTGGMTLAWSDGSAAIGQGGGGGNAIGRGTSPSYTSLRGATATTAGSGGGGGGIWQASVTKTASADTYRIVAAENGTAGGVWIRHSKPARELAPYTPPATGWNPRIHSNSAPLAPRITITPDGEPSLAEPITIRIVPTDPDYGDIAFAWTLRRSINDGDYEYLSQDGRSAAAQDVWLASNSSAARRPVDPDLGYLTFDYELRPGWGNAGESIVFEAQTWDADEEISLWQASRILNPAVDLPPSQPVLSSLPAGTAYETGLRASTLPITVHSDAEDIVLSWIHSDPDDSPQIGYRLLRKAVRFVEGGGVTSTRYLRDNATGTGFDWVGPSSADRALLQNDPGPEGQSSATVITGDGDDTASNWIASTASMLTLAPAVWANYEAETRYTFALTTITEGVVEKQESPFSNALVIKEQTGIVEFAGLPSGVQPTFTIGGATRQHAFTVAPAAANVVASSSDDLFTIAITGSGTDRVLEITPPTSDQNDYEDTITITGTLAGYETATHEATFPLTEPPAPVVHDLVISGLLEAYTTDTDTTLELPFEITPVVATSYSFSSSNPSVATLELDIGGIDDPRTLTINPVGVGTSVISLRAIRDGYNTAHHTITLTVESARDAPSFQHLLGYFANAPGGSYSIATIFISREGLARRYFSLDQADATLSFEFYVNSDPEPEYFPDAAVATAEHFTTLTQGPFSTFDGVRDWRLEFAPSFEDFGQWLVGLVATNTDGLSTTALFTIITY